MTVHDRRMSHRGHIFSIVLALAVPCLVAGCGGG